MPLSAITKEVDPLVWFQIAASRLGIEFNDTRCGPGYMLVPGIIIYWASENRLPAIGVGF